MIRAASPLALVTCVLACALAMGCAAPGDPTARHPVVPTAITDLAAQQYGAAFTLAFTLPQRSMDHEALPEHPTIEIYRADLPPGGIPVKQTNWRLVITIPSEQTDHYLKGERVEFRDSLAADEFARVAGSSLAYKVRTRAVKARASGDSNIVTARIYPPQDAPQDVHVEVTESALVVSWPETPLPPGATARAYRVYRATMEAGQENSAQDLTQVKLKTPLQFLGSAASPEFHDSQFQFATHYLYTVRAVVSYGADAIQSADSLPVAVTPRDIFPPAAPTGLEIAIVPATPQAPAYVELSWAINQEADLAGYSVYRSEGEGIPEQRISVETLLSPTFRDISIQPGRRYTYRVSAQDRAGNESEKSSAAVANVP